MPYYEPEEAAKLMHGRKKKRGSKRPYKSDMGGYGPSLIFEIVSDGRDPEEERSSPMSDEDIEVREALVDELLGAIEAKDKAGIWAALTTAVDMIQSDCAIADDY